MWYACIRPLRCLRQSARSVPLAATAADNRASHLYREASHLRAILFCFFRGLFFSEKPADHLALTFVFARLRYLLASSVSSTLARASPPRAAFSPMAARAALTVVCVARCIPTNVRQKGSCGAKYKAAIRDSRSAGRGVAPLKQRPAASAAPPPPSGCYTCVSRPAADAAFVPL